MLLYLGIAFAVIPVIEIYLLIQAGEVFGTWPTIAFVIAAAFLGAYLLKRQGLQTLNRAAFRLQQGNVPIAEMVDGICLAMAGALLLTPGFLTDVVGLLLLLPPIRALIRKRLVQQFSHFSQNAQPQDGHSTLWVGGVVFDGEIRRDFRPHAEQPPQWTRPNQGPIIDGEVVKEEESANQRVPAIVKDEPTNDIPQEPIKLP